MVEDLGFVHDDLTGDSPGPSQHGSIEGDSELHAGWERHTHRLAVFDALLAQDVSESEKLWEPYNYVRQHIILVTVIQPNQDFL